MKKFTDITNKDTSLDFDKKKQKDNLSSDIDSLNDQMDDAIKGTKLEGEWEIQEIISVTTNEPEIPANEAIVINAELGNNPVKRGDFIYITALINKKGGYIHQNQMGVIKVRIVEIYNTLLVLNQLR